MNQIEMKENRIGVRNLPAT